MQNRSRYNSIGDKIFVKYAYKKWSNGHEYNPSCKLPQMKSTLGIVVHSPPYTGNVNVVRLSYKRLSDDITREKARHIRQHTCLEGNYIPARSRNMGQIGWWHKSNMHGASIAFFRPTVRQPPAWPLRNTISQDQHLAEKHVRAYRDPHLTLLAVCPGSWTSHAHIQFADQTPAPALP